MVSHYRIERSSKMIVEKRKEVLKTKGKLDCEVCSFNFLDGYGSISLDFCEVHHLIPLSQLTEKHKTRLVDLAIMCSNCHRMLHQCQPCLTIDELKNQLRG